MTAQSLPAKTGAVKPRLRGLKTLLTHPTLRRISQLFFAGFIAFIAIQHLSIGEEGPIITATAEAFCPLGGLETLYQTITTGGSFISHTHLSNLVVLVAVLVTSLLLRSAFCGWICPLGFLQDLMSNLSKVIQKRVPGLRRSITAIKKHKDYRAVHARLAVLDRYLRFARYLVLGWVVGGAAYFGVMVFRDYDPWSTLLNLAEYSFTPGVVVLLITLVASLFVERPWCRYACPLGAATGLLGKLSPVYLKREASSCTTCKLCSQACPMGLDVHQASTITSAECITCLECVSACPRNGALEVKIGWPILGQ